MATVVCIGNMSGIKLIPEGGEDPIEVPTDSIVIGRGAFLKVSTFL